jgi:RNA polymerase sigma-70 factor (ECF subfamily)
MESESPQTGESTILSDYLPKLIRLAERNMSRRLQSKVDPTEMAGSILASVVRMAREGKLNIEATDMFWKLLVAISLNKVRKKARFYSAQKRDAGREYQIVEDMPSLEQLAVSHGSPTEEDGELIANVLNLLDEELDDDCRTVLAGKLEGLSNFDIASRLGENGKSTKTVTRCWKKVEDATRKIAESLDLE